MDLGHMRAVAHELIIARDAPEYEGRKNENNKGAEHQTLVISDPFKKAHLELQQKRRTFVRPHLRDCYIS